MEAFRNRPSTHLALGAAVALAFLPAGARAATCPLEGADPTGTATRPQLAAEQATQLTVRQYLGDWRPAPVGRIGGHPTYIVGPGGTHASVQGAVTAAVESGTTSPVLIAVRPGTYREVVCVPTGAPPITLYGTGSSAQRTVIVSDHANPTPKVPGTAANPCTRNAASSTYGTSGSATVTVFADGFRAANITVANDYEEGTFPGGNQSAVALLARGDRQVYDGVRVLGNQDTLYSSTPATTVVSRQYFVRCWVEGDTDFVFGRGTAVFDRSTIVYRSQRRTDGVIFAPSTAATVPTGFLVTRSRLQVSGEANHTVRLGRAWDQSVGSLASYVNGISPNGQVLIRESYLAGHLILDAPWGPSTISRAYCSADCTYSPNRFFEYRNTGPGSASAGTGRHAIPRAV